MRLLGLFILGLFCQSISAQVFFADAAADQGINHQYGLSIPGGGVSFCDFDGDGWDDITLATDTGYTIQFYQNIEGQLTLISPLIEYTGKTEQLLWVDFDNDGDKDLYMATLRDANRLYENIGNLQLVDITEQAGLPLDSSSTYGAAFGDYDRDGWLDLYYGCRTGVIPENRMLLFHNNADGTFTEVAWEAGVIDPGNVPFCSAFLDYNNDHWPDIYTANDRFTRNTLLENDGDGTFSDVSFFANAGLFMNAMCVAPGDYNNDGWLDIYITNTEQGNALLRNQGNNSFQNVSVETGTAFFAYGWGASFFDADNDGWEDLYVSGMLTGTDVISSAFYYNEQNGTFAHPLDAGFAGDTVRSFNNAVGDFDQDGRNDIMVINTTPNNSHLWHNQSTTENHWIKIKLQGVLSNRDGIGSRIMLYTNGLQQTRFTTCGSGFLGQHSETLTIGLGATNVIDSILVKWPTGHIDRLQAVDSGQTLMVSEGSTTDGNIMIDPELEIAVSTNLPLTESTTNLHLFPNPATNRIHLRYFGNTVPAFYYVIDSNGKLIQTVKTSNSSELSFAVSHLQTGVYRLIWQESGLSRKSKSFLKQ